MVATVATVAEQLNMDILKISAQHALGFPGTVASLVIEGLNGWLAERARVLATIQIIYVIIVILLLMVIIYELRKQTTMLSEFMRRGSTATTTKKRD